MCLSQEALGKEGGAGGVPRENRGALGTRSAGLPRRGMTSQGPSHHFAGWWLDDRGETAEIAFLPGCREKALCPISTKRNGSYPQTCWSAPLSMADGSGSSHPWPGSRWARGLQAEHSGWFARSSLGCNKLRQKQLPLSESSVPSPRAQLHCRSGWFFFLKAIAFV